VPGTISKLFYRQEVMLSTTCETSPTVAIVGRCAVLDYCDYITRRPTEIAESDVYLCEATYDELKKEIKKTFGATVHLRSFVHTQMVTADEIYFFKRPIMPPKVSRCRVEGSWINCVLLSGQLR
jgi:protein polybromo-1